MIERQRFIRNSLLATTIVALPGPYKFSSIMKRTFTSKRLSLNKRLFVSEAVEETIAKLKSSIQDNELSWLFENCFPNTLDSTVKYHKASDKPDTFIITGDINAMWLRESSAQVWPYLFLVNSDPKLQKFTVGLINRQVKCVLIDPYANAFNFEP